MLPRPASTTGFIEPCIPTRAAKPPAAPGWVHEIKHDGYRLIVRRDGAAVRLFTRRGYDWTDRYPAIAAAAGKLRARSFTLPTQMGSHRSNRPVSGGSFRDVLNFRQAS